MISYEYENLFKNDSVDKQLIITDGDTINLTNEDIYQESFSLSEGICTNSELIFGSCVSGMLKFTTSNLSSFIGKRLRVSVVLNNHSEEPFEIGEFIVTEDTLTADRSKKEIVACDVLSSVLQKNGISWYESLTFPLTLKTFRDSLFTYLDIPQAEITLVNDDMLVEETITSEVLSVSDVIQAICELNGVFGHISRDGLFTYVLLGSTSVSTIDASLYRSATYETYDCSVINKLQIRMEENDIGVVVGTGDNAYIVEDNFLIYGLSTDLLTPIANNLYSVIHNVPIYRPCNIECIGNPCIEVGDRITIETTDTEFDTFVMSRELRGIQSLVDTITAEGEEKRTEKVAGLTYEIMKLKGKSNVLTRTIEETNSRITDVESGLQSEIRQTSDTIELQIQDLQSQIDGEITYWETTETPTLLNYPYWDFCTNIPCNNTVRTTNDLRFVYTETDRKKHLRDLCFDKENLISYRFVKEDDAWGWQEIADTETAVILQRISQLEITTEGIQTNVGQISYELDNNVYTKVETNSQIQQSADAIVTSVSQTYATKTTTNTMQSQINQQASQISAKVSQTGGTSSSFGWSLTSSAFELKSQNNTVFKADSTGVTVRGNAEITGGNIDLTATSDSDVRFRVKNTQNKRVDISPYGVNIYYNTDSTFLTALSVTTGEVQANDLKSRTLNGTISVNSPLNFYKDVSLVAGDLTIPGQHELIINGSIKLNSGSVLKSASHTLISPSGYGVRVGDSSGRVGFFGGDGATRKSVPNLASSSTLATVITKVNSLLDALRSYNLIS